MINEKETQNKTVLDWALYYRDVLKWSVIPIRKGTKEPYIRWQEFQDRLPSLEEVSRWYARWPEAGVAAVTGRISNIIVVDVEDGGKIEDLPPTVTAFTGGNGSHHFYIYPNKPVRGGVRVRELTDLQADGRYVVLPPSIHPSDKSYSWLVSPENADFKFANPPEWIFERTDGVHDNRDWQRVLAGVSRGERNTDATVVIGKLISVFPQSEWNSFVWPLAKDWNDKNEPPLGEQELRSVFESIASRQTGKVKSQSIYSADFLTQNKGLEFISVEDLLKLELPPVAWAVQGLIPKLGITGISGQPKVGKSLLGLELAISVAINRQFLGKFDVEQCGVLIVAKEDPLNLLQDRVKAFSRDSSEINLLFCTDSNLFLDTKDRLEELKKIAKEREIGLIIFDSFRRIFRGEENSSTVINEVQINLKELTNEGITVVFIHHHGKEGFFHKKIANPEKLRGSSDIFAMLDSLLMVEKEDQLTLKIIPAGLRSSKPLSPFFVELESTNDKVSGFKFLKFVEEEREKSKSARDDVLAILSEESLTQKEIIERLEAAGRIPGEYSSTTVKNAIKWLYDAGRIGKDGSLYFCSEVLESDEENPSVSPNAIEEPEEEEAQRDENG